jgi:hypothetical protein
VSAHLLLVSFCVFSKMLVELVPLFHRLLCCVSGCVHTASGAGCGSFRVTCTRRRRGHASCDLSLCQERRGVLYRDNHSRLARNPEV